MMKKSRYSFCLSLLQTYGITDKIVKDPFLFVRLLRFALKSLKNSLNRVAGYLVEDTLKKHEGAKVSSYALITRVKTISS